MVTMAVAPGRRDACREMVDPLPWGERQRRRAVTLWFGQAVDGMVGVTRFQTFKRERRACAVAQQPLQAGAILRAHAHLGVERETAVLPGEHFADVITLE
jgi:hypothetical protein